VVRSSIDPGRMQHGGGGLGAGARRGVDQRAAVADQPRQQSLFLRLV
jgi:hypothetical protein